MRAVTHREPEPLHRLLQGVQSPTMLLSSKGLSQSVATDIVRLFGSVSGASGLILTITGT